MSPKIKWGLLTGLVYVIFALINNLLGLQEEGGFTLKAVLSNAALFGVTFFTIYLGIKEMRDSSSDGNMTFGQGFRNGMGITLIASLMVFAFTLIYLYVIDPGMIDKIMQMAEDQWEEQGMTEEQMDAARKYMGIFMKPWAMSLMAVASCLFWGLIKSLICASILKKEGPPTVPTT